ncbi:hypothetical protein NFI95_09815 [Acetobacteraceae bacterium KSS8]|uniref:Formate hydrogenlyase subunit 4 n=1 Tax=Endosaccharibacter trunci TaxID=2812733 RepID=A0ABT1WAA3_9PROT|nr:hypothetical protein [Acetobacteraceae bacterium KSS8]
MNQLGLLALGSAALVLHVGLLLLATPLMAIGAEGFPALRSPAAWRGWLAQPFLRLATLASREPVRSEGASPVPRLAPILSLACTGCAALLVPSFLRVMLDWPLADLALVLALLGTSRGCWLFAAADGGSAATGLAAIGATVDALLALPGLVLSASVLLMLSGGAGLDAMLAGQRGLAAPGALACVAGLGLGALASGGREAALSQALSGPDLALFRLETGLRRVVWIDLLGALAWPGSVAAAPSGPLFWLSALLCWLLRFGMALALFALLSGPLGDPGLRRRLAAFSLFAALLGPILLLAGQSAE